MTAANLTIAHLTASRFFGGPERQMLELAAHLAPQVRSVFISFAEQGLCQGLVRQVVEAGFSAAVLEHDTPHLRAAARGLANVLRREGVQVVCCHGYKSNLVGRLVATRLGLPAISVSRGWTGETWRVKLYEWIDRRALRAMDKVICVSQAQAVKVRRAGVASKQILVIPNAIRTERFQRADTAGRQQLAALFPQPPRWIVGAGGRLSPEKGFDDLITAAAACQRDLGSVGFLLYGEGVLRSRLESQIAALGLGDWFKLAGFRKSLDDVIPHCDLWAMSSHTEGLPNVALEAMAAGVPVVATAVGGLPELIESGCNGLLTPAGVPCALGAAIVSLLANDALRRQYGEAARQRVVEHFSFEAQSEAYLRVFDHLLSSGRRPTELATSVL